MGGSYAVIAEYLAQHGDVICKDIANTSLYTEPREEYLELFVDTIARELCERLDMTYPEVREHLSLELITKTVGQKWWQQSGASS